MAAFGLQFVEEVAADLALDSHGVEGEILVAAAGAHGKRGELFRADFFPRGFAKGLDWIGSQVRTAQHACDSEMRNTANAGQAL
jgi:hypothetical protein